MDRILIFANPIAGRGQGGHLARQLADRLRAAGFAVDVNLGKPHALHRPTPDLHATIVIGGDGTLRTVTQWAVDHGLYGTSTARPACPLLIVPMGTANLMGKHLGIRWTQSTLADDVLAAIRTGRIVNLDLAQTGNGVFLLMAGIGFDAWVVHELDRLRSGPIQLTDYLQPALNAMRCYAFPRLTVTVDNRILCRDTPALAMVGNVSEYGTGFALLPDARPDDRLLDVCVMPCDSRRQLIELFLSAAAGEHVKREGVIYVKGTRIQIDSPQPVPVQADGEAAGFTPTHIDLLPGSVPFIVPPGRTGL